MLLNVDSEEGGVNRNSALFDNDDDGENWNRPPARLSALPDPSASRNSPPYAADHDYPDNRATYHPIDNNSIANYNHPIDNNNNKNNNNHADNYTIHDINNPNLL